MPAGKAVLNPTQTPSCERLFAFQDSCQKFKDLRALDSLKRCECFQRSRFNHLSPVRRALHGNEGENLQWIAGLIPWAWHMKLLPVRDSTVALEALSPTRRDASEPSYPLSIVTSAGLALYSANCKINFVVSLWRASRIDGTQERA